MKTKISVEISDKLLQDVLVSGFEGGSNYWLLIRNDLTPMGEDYTVTLFDTGLMVQDEYTKKKVKLTKAKIKKAIKLMSKKSPNHFASIMDENFDANTGDVLLQYAVNGEILYG